MKYFTNLNTVLVRYWENKNYIPEVYKKIHLTQGDHLIWSRLHIKGKIKKIKTRMYY